MMRKVKLAGIVILLCVSVTGCVDQPTATTKPLPTAVLATAAPTDVPTATPTPFPTDTPEPTRTPTPTDTPKPTLTPTPVATATPEVVLTRIGDVTAARVGEEVAVEGQVVRTESFSAGFKFTLDDGTGRVILLIWHDVYDDCRDAPEINLGAQVRATGEIGEYDGELQIQPSFGGDVEAVEGAGPWAPARDVGSLSGDDEGQRVMIEGSVTRVEGRDTWAKVFVGDETGQALVFIYQNVLARIPNNSALGQEGTRVRVVGVVERYGGDLEVVPALPYDVVVLD
jgi:DNA/RNA endonuclease YhcR with UshA esterase domain